MILSTFSEEQILYELVKVKELMLDKWTMTTALILRIIVESTNR